MIRPGIGPRPIRLVLLAGAVALLGVAGWGGLVRIGWAWPAPGSASVADHGALMVTGFVATLVATIRAVTSLRPPWLVVPGLLLLASVALAIGAPAPLPAALALAGALGLVAMGLRAPPPGASAVVLPLLSAACLAVGNALWLASATTPTVWWMCFALFAIAGQRLDIDPRLNERRATAIALGLGAALAVVGAVVSVSVLPAGLRLAGAGFVGIAAWGIVDDAAPKLRSARAAFARFAASAALSAYAFLALAGMLAIVVGGVPGSPAYDAAIHVFFAGTVLSAVFGHLGTYAPGILGLTIRASAASYAALALLDGSVLARVVGDLAGAGDVVRIASVLIGIAVALFLLVTAASLRSRRVYERSD